MSKPEEPVAGRLAWGRKFWVAVAVMTAILVSAWLFVPWQWSPVDDPGQVIIMRELVSQHGAPWAFVERFQQLALGDQVSGVFRPMAWIYPPLIYLLPSTPAHVIRLLMLVFIVLGPIVYFRRRGARPAVLLMILALLVISAGTLYQGLFLLSIQEVGGMALVSLGLMTNRRTLRLILWLLAALFKGPFLWILFGYALVLWREGRRRLAIASMALGFGLLAVNFWWSLGGSYTGGYRLAPWEPYQWINASKILEPMNGAILLAALWWLIITQTQAKRRSDFPIFAFAAVGYFVQMIPWGFTAYYMGPISFLLGLMLASVLTDAGEARPWTSIVGIAVPSVVAAWVLLGSVGFVLRSNAIIQQSSECLSLVTNAKTELVGGWLYLTSSEEGPLRLQQNTELFYPDWNGEVTLDSWTESSSRDESITHVLVMPGASLPPEESGSFVCEKGYVSLLELG